MFFSSPPGIRIYSNLMDTMDSIGTPFHPLIQQEWNFLSLSRIEKWTFPSESIRVQWIRWTPSERLSTPSSNMRVIFLSLSRIEKMCFSIGIYSCPMDPMDSIGTTFHLLIHHEWDFCKSLTNRKWTFPSESIRVQWIRWTPSELLSTPFVMEVAKESGGRYPPRTVYSIICALKRYLE